MHRRIQPIDHHFNYKFYFYGFDLSELFDLDRDLRWFGWHCRLSRNFHARDHDQNDQNPDDIGDDVQKRIRSEFLFCIR